MSVDGILVSLLLTLKRFSRCLGLYLDDIYGNFEKAFPFSERSGYSMGSVPNWYQTGNKTCYIPNVSKFYIDKRYLR